MPLLWWGAVRRMTEDPSDEVLIARCRQHDEEAWRALVDRYASYVYTIATRVFGLTGEDASEVLQESLLKVFEGLPGYRGDGPFRAWLRQVVLHVAAGYLRRRRPTEALPAGLVDPAQEDRLEGIEHAYVLTQALRELDQLCQQIISLFFLQSQPYKAIAARLGMPEGTVASRLARCLTKLRSKIPQPR